MSTMTELGIDKFFDTRNSGNNSTIKEDGQFLLTAETLYSNMNLNLRQIEKQFIHLSIVLKTFSHNSYLHPGVIVLLEYLGHMHHNIYEKIYSRDYTIDELVGNLENCLPNNIISKEDDYSDRMSHRFIWEVGMLICCYAEGENQSQTIELVTKEKDPKLLFNCKVFNKEKMLSVIRHELEHSHYNGIFDIRLLISHLELLKDISVG